MSDLPPFDDIPPEHLDMERIPVIVAAAMAGQPDELYGMFARGELAGRFETSPFDADGWLQVFAAGLPVARIHYSQLWTGRPLDLAANPPTQLPSERAPLLEDDAADFPPPPDLPEDLIPFWHMSADKHGGDEVKFQWYLQRVLEYLGVVPPVFNDDDVPPSNE